MSLIAFQYRAIHQSGEKTRGVLRACDRQDAYRQIVAAGLKPLKITNIRISPRARSRRVKLKDLSHFTYQFSVLMSARIPIADGLRSIAEQEPNMALRDVIEDIARQIEGGSAIIDAFRPYQDMFGEVYLETLRAAEVSGNMVKVLEKLAEMLEQRYETSKNVKGALMYPICVVVALAGAVTFLMMAVVPKFAQMYSSRGLELPVPTQILTNVSAIMTTYWYVFVVAILASIVVVRRAWARAGTRAMIDRWLHSIPFLRNVLIGLAVSRFSHVLGVCLQSGLGLIDALEMSGKSSGRPLLLLDSERMREQVRHGGRLSDVFLACRYLPAFARRMISAGEEAAEMPRMCEIVARHYDREVSHLTRNVSTVIEPIMIVGLAAVVLMVALAIFLPMWNMAALLK
jgi:type II secretory pathway component PulF